MNRMLLSLFLLLVSLLAEAQSNAVADSLEDEAFFKELGEMAVTGERPIAKMELGKIVYDMQALGEQLPSDNAYELITRMPGVALADGKLTVAGKEVTLIMNGKKTLLDASQLEELLKSMPADRLLTAELMMAAPAQYNVRGAVINLVTTDHSRKDVLTGQLQGSYNQDKYAEGTGKASLLFKRGGLSVDAVYSHTNGNTYAKVAHTAVQPLETGAEYYADGIENKTRRVRHNLYLSPSYDFPKGGSLSLAYNGSWADEHSRNTSTEGEMYTQRGVEHTYLNNLDAQYTAPFGLRLGASVLTYNSPQEQELEGGIGGEDKSRNSQSHQDIRKYLFTASQEHKLKHSWGVNYGAKVQLTKQASWQETFLPDGTPIEAGNARVDYTERIGSGYLSLSKGFGEKLSLEAGVELEKFHTPTVSDWQAYPTLNLLWSPSVSHILSLSLGSDSDYPSYWDMMSSVYYSSVYTEIWGNPSLTPSHDYSLSLTYRLRQRYVFTLFADFEDDYFIQLPYQPADRMAVVMQSTNWDYSRQLGVQATAQFFWGKWLTGNASATAMYRHDKSDSFAVPFDRSALTTILGANLNCKLCPRQGLSLLVNPFAQFNALQGVYDIGTYFRLNATLRWQSPKGHWAVSAACRNITNSRIRTSDTWAGQNFKMDVWQDWRTFALTLSYKFGRYQEWERKQADTSRLGH